MLRRCDGKAVMSRSSSHTVPPSAVSRPAITAQQGALPDARRAEQRDHLAGGDLQRDPIEHGAVAEPNGDLTCREHRALPAVRPHR